MKAFKDLARIAQIALIIVAILTTSGCGPTDLPEARVTKVIDGDTIEVSINGTMHTIRYIGIDTPESDDLFGDEATAANQALVGGETVYLEKDVSETDRYDRLLRYVYLSDGTFVNAELVRLGWAEAKAYPPDTRYQGQLKEMEQEARREGRGVWR